MKYLLLILSIVIVSCNSKGEIDKAHSLKGTTLDLIKNRSYTEAIDTAKIALEIFHDAKEASEETEMHYHIARASAMDGNFQQAREYGEKGSTLAKETNNLELEYKINNILSWSYFSLGMGFEETMTHQQRQLELVKLLDNDDAKAMVYNNYGYDATVSGLVNLDSAIHYTKWANDFYGKKENTHGRWYTLMNLCWQHRLKNELELSEVYGIHSLSQAKADSDRHAIIEAATNLSETLIAQQKMDQAGEKLKEAYEFANEQQDRDKYVFDIYNAHYLGEIGKLDEAVELLKPAVDFLSEGEVFYEMLGRALLATYAFQIGQHELARENINAFDNPRANYFSFEAKVIAEITRSKIENDPHTLSRMIEKSKAINATYLTNLMMN
ncbi:hypothetical protein [Ekhidna sp.]|uniref:hypothetical protein n=1 Tax=Ekhidna sp. TaxID=2608089 RepID=UPI003515AC85